MRSTRSSDTCERLLACCNPVNFHNRRVRRILAIKKRRLSFPDSRVPRTSDRTFDKRSRGNRALHHRRVYDTPTLSPLADAAARIHGDPSSKQTRGMTSVRLPRGSSSCSAAARTAVSPIRRGGCAPRIPHAFRTRFARVRSLGEDARAARRLYDSIALRRIATHCVARIVIGSLALARSEIGGSERSAVANTSRRFFQNWRLYSPQDGATEKDRRRGRERERERK